jgi:hypothetical protein
MKTVLIFPPYLVSYQPYSSLPTLGAYLRSHSYPVDLLDENIEFINYHMEPSYFQNIYQNTLKIKKHLQQKTAHTKHELLVISYIDNYLNASHFTSVVNDIHTSLEILRNRKLIADEFKASKARDVVFKAQNLIHHYIRLTQIMRRESEELTFNLQWDDISSEVRAENDYKEYFQKISIPKIVACKPDVVGISIVFEDQLIPAFILAQAIKHTPALGTTHITFGGPVITILQDVIKKHTGLFSLIDSCVLYEGEQALLHLLENLRLGRGLDEVPNLMYVKNGHIVRNEIKMITDLDSLPTPDFDGLPLDKYCSPSLVPILKPTRGCYWNKCTFCNNKYLNNYTTYRMRSPERLFEDFINLSHKYSTNEFTIWDEAAVPKCLKRLAELITKSNYSFKWFAEARFDKIYTEDFLKSLYQGGCRAMIFGLESGNRRIQQLMNKGYDLEICKRILRNCRRAKIRVHLTLMMGFPTETPQEVLDTINYVAENNRYICHAGVSHFTLKKYTETYDHPENFGISYNKNHLSFSSTGDLNYGINNNGMTFEESMLMYKFMRQRLPELGFTSNEPECHYLIRCSPRRVH